MMTQIRVNAEARDARANWAYVEGCANDRIIHTQTVDFGYWEAFH